MTKDTVNWILKATITIPCNELLADGCSCQNESGRLAATLAMNIIIFSVPGISLAKQAEMPARLCAHGNRHKTALRECSSSGLVSSSRRMLLFSSIEPGSGESHEDPAEDRETPEAEAAPVSTTGTRDVS